MNTLFALIFFPIDSSMALYAALFAILILSGVGLPVPEEATLLLGGYLAYLEFINYWVAILVLTAGIVVADAGGYFLGRYVGSWIEGKFLLFGFPTRLLDRGKYYFEKHGEKMVIFTRPLLGVRVVVPILAGHFRMNFMKFFVYDIIAAIPWTFFLVSLSYYLGAGLDLITEVREIKQLFFVLVWVGLVIYAVRFVRKGK